MWWRAWDRDHVGDPIEAQALLNNLWARSGEPGRTFVVGVGGRIWVIRYAAGVVSDQDGAGDAP